MHTTIIKMDPTPPYMFPINPDGKVWLTKNPNVPKDILASKKYHACIPDERLYHCRFESFGWHYAWADTIGELIKDIRSFSVPYYSENKFLNDLKKRDANDTRSNLQVELHWDGRGTSVKRGHLTMDNMTEYTSF